MNGSLAGVGWSSRRIDESSVLEAWVGEVQEDPPGKSGCPQVVKNLRIFDRRKGADGFQFDDYGLVADKICPVMGSQRASAIVYQQAGFPLVRNARLKELDFQSLLIHCFQETRPELTMDPHRGTDDSVRLCICFRVAVDVLVVWV